MVWIGPAGLFSQTFLNSINYSCDIDTTVIYYGKPWEFGD